MRVVIADDSRPVRQWLAAKLTVLGHNLVGSAENAREAVDLCRSLHPDVAIIDINMPSNDSEIPNGDTAAETIKRDGLATFVVLATSQRQRPVVDLAARLGVSLIIKPYSPEMLKATFATLR